MVDEAAGRPGIRPAHPGRILRRAIDASGGMTVDKFADHIGVSRQTVHAILSSRSKVTPDVAARLGKAFGNSPLFWLNLQNKHDIWQAEGEPQIRMITPISSDVRSDKSSKVISDKSRAATAAAKVMTDPKPSKHAKSAAGSALTQASKKAPASPGVGLRKSQKG